MWPNIQLESQRERREEERQNDDDDDDDNTNRRNNSQTFPKFDKNHKTKVNNPSRQNKKNPCQVHHNQTA